MVVQLLFSWKQTFVLAKVPFGRTYWVDLEKVLNCKLALAVKISLCGCNGQRIMRLKILRTVPKTYFGFALQQKCRAFFVRERKKMKSGLESVNCVLKKSSLLSVHPLRHSLWHGEEPVGLTYVRYDVMNHNCCRWKRGPKPVSVVTGRHLQLFDAVLDLSLSVHRAFSGGHM